MFAVRDVMIKGNLKITDSFAGIPAGAKSPAAVR